MTDRRFNIDDYIDVQSRIVRFWREHPDGSIRTRLVSPPDDFERCRYEAAVFKHRDSALPDATGFAFEVAGGRGPNATSHEENCECVPLRSEILTRRGFTHFADAKIDEDVLAYDAATDRCTWTPLLDVRVFASAPVVRFGNTRRWSFECTPDHKWAINRRGNSASFREVREAHAIKSSDAIIVAAPAPGGDHPLTPSEASILGWLITDGHIARRGEFHVRGQISQSKERNFPMIREALTELGAMGPKTEYRDKARTRTFPTGRTYDTKPTTKWQVPAGVTRLLLEKAEYRTDGDLPGLVTQLTAEARTAMLEALLAAEGDEVNRFAQKRAGVMDAFQILCVLEGRALGRMATSSWGACSIQGVRRTRHVHGSELGMTAIGPRSVWCPTTAYGTWVMRQDGNVTITGNTSAIGRALANMGYATSNRDRPSREEMEKVSPRDASVARQDAPQSTNGRTNVQRGGPQRGTAPQGGAPGAPAWQRQNARLHAVVAKLGDDHTGVHALMALKGHASVKDASVDDLKGAADWIERTEPTAARTMIANARIRLASEADDEPPADRAPDAALFTPEDQAALDADTDRVQRREAYTR